LSPNKGILIFNSFVVDRGPDENFIGCWLTRTKKFFQYAVQVDPNTHHLNKVDTWNDITDATQVSAKEPGVGETFGYLAFEVLKKLK